MEHQPNSVALVVPAENEVGLEERPTPVPGENQALVEVAYSGISVGTELWAATGKFHSFGPMPFVAGYQAVGRVIAMNGASSDFGVGDFVACFVMGSHRKYVSVDYGLAHRVDPGDTLAQSALFVQPSVGANALNHAEVKKGDTVLVVGQGLIGQSTALLARLRGAYVIGSDISEERLALSAAHCVDLSLDATVAPPSEQLAEQFPEGVDIVIESTGFAGLVDDAMKCVRKGGRFVFEGFYPGKLEFEYLIPHTKQISAVFPCFIGEPPVRQGVLKMIQEGYLDMGSLVSDVVPWTEAAEFYRRLFTPERDRINGVVIDWRDSNGPTEDRA